jgi:hypothetical protein
VLNPLLVSPAHSWSVAHLTQKFKKAKTSQINTHAFVKARIMPHTCCSYIYTRTGVLGEPYYTGGSCAHRSGSGSVHRYACVCVCVCACVCVCVCACVSPTALEAAVPTALAAVACIGICVCACVYVCVCVCVLMWALLHWRHLCPPPLLRSRALVIFLHVRMLCLCPTYFYLCACVCVLGWSLCWRQLCVPLSLRSRASVSFYCSFV